MVDTIRAVAPPMISPDEPAALLGGFVPCGCRSEATSQWFVLATAYQAERAVERAVRKLGMPAWLGQHEDAHHRIRLMFPRYVLFQADLASNDRWRNLYTQPGVETVLGTRGERPTPLPAGSTDALFERCAEDGVIYQEQKPVPPVLPAPFANGSEVQIKTGVFQNWTAVCTWSTAKRVGVLLSMFGTEIRTSLPHGDVRAVLSQRKQGL